MPTRVWVDAVNLTESHGRKPWLDTSGRTSGVYSKIQVPELRTGAACRNQRE
jgi:hypothetical protein